LWWLLLAFIYISPAQAATYYFHNDHLRTPVALTDGSQRVVWKGSQDPFGENNPTTNLLEQNLRFPGQYFDIENGLHYNYFRSYEPLIGRYTQSDPIGLHGGMNSYSYTSNNPLSYSDELGLFYGAGSRWGWGFSFGNIQSATGFPQRSEHSTRNQHNFCTQYESELESHCPVYQQDTGLAALINKGREKYRNADGSECGYDSQGNLLPDEYGNYTYNFEPDSNNPRHIWKDVIPHYWYGGNETYIPNLTNVK